MRTLCTLGGDWELCQENKQREEVLREMYLLKTELTGPYNMYAYAQFLCMNVL